jgi:hypothetical protein
MRFPYSLWALRQNNLIDQRKDLKNRRGETSFEGTAYDNAITTAPYTGGAIGGMMST